MSYYADKLESLGDVFGRPVGLVPGGLRVGEAVYPVVDGVVILLDPAQYPAALRGRLSPGADSEGFAEDIQFTFGEEWKSFPAVMPEHEQEFRDYFDLVDLSGLRGSRVCDLGCGIGRWSYFLKDRCRQLVLVDFSEAIFVARRNLCSARNALFFMADLTRLPFRADFADFLFCLGVLHHLPTDALAEVVRLRRLAPRLLVYLYYALDNRPFHFRLLMGPVTAVRQGACRIRDPRFRSLFTAAVAAGLYLPLICLGKAAAPLGLGRHVPLYEQYRDKGLARIRQDVYDRFFTRIEQRVRRDQIAALPGFRRITVSERLPYWHFLCER